MDNFDVQAFDGMSAANSAESLLIAAWAARTHDLEQTQHLTLEALGRTDLTEYARSQAERNLGFVALRHANYALAGEKLTSGALLARTAAAPLLEAECLSYRAMVYSSLGQYAEAIETQLIALGLRQVNNDEVGEGQSLGNLGVVYGYIGDFAVSLEYHMRALELRTRSGDEAGRALTLNNIGVAYFELGDGESALDYHVQALRLAKAINHRQIEVFAQVNLGADLHALKRYEESQTVNATALNLAKRLGDRESQIEALNHEGRALAGLGQLESAFEMHQQALAAAREIGSPALEYRCLADIGRTYLDMDELDPAVTHLKEALVIAERVGLKRDVFWTHERLSLALERAGNPVAALNHHRAFYAVEREVQGERAAARVKTLALRFETVRVQQETHFERQRNEALAEVNAALRSANDEKSLLMEKLEHQATHDILTGLPNRALFQNRFEHALVTAARYGRNLAVMFVDLDGFKLVNDTLGHHRGDTLLVEVAKRFQAVVRDSDTVARMGGDEFTVIVSEFHGHADASRVALRLIEALKTPFCLDDHEVTVTASVGVSLFPEDGDQAEALARYADLALYRAKEEGRNTVRFYAPEMNAIVQERGAIKSSLRGALERDEFELHFQPLVRTDGRTVMVEALLRWTHGVLGAVGPDRFIPVAEDSGAIVEIGDWVLRTALKQLSQWRAQGFEVERVAVNVSPVQLAREDYVHSVTSALLEFGLTGSSLELEITEHIIVRDLQRVSARLEALRLLGVTVAVDDFGSGYSSLSYLARLPVDVLKIDRTIVAAIGVQNAGERLVAAILALGLSLGLKVVAEGVETQAHFKALTDLGCQCFQGYLWTKPLPSVAVTAWFTTKPHPSELL